MISQPSKGSRIPSLTGIFSGTATMNGASTALQTLLSITGKAGVLNKLSTTDTLSGSGGNIVTFQVKIDGVAAVNISVAAGTSAFTDLLADTADLRRAFPNGIAFRSSLVITAQQTVANGSSLVATYNVATVDTL